jgi:hypothetical protein
LTASAGASAPDSGVVKSLDGVPSVSTVWRHLYRTACLGYCCVEGHLVPNLAGRGNVSQGVSQRPPRRRDLADVSDAVNRVS